MAVATFYGNKVNRPRNHNMRSQ